MDLRKVVHTLLYRRRPRGLQPLGQKVHVSLLIRRDLLQVGVEGCVIAGSGEGVGTEVREALAVEGVFQVLEGERVVEDVGVASAEGGFCGLAFEHGGDGEGEGGGCQRQKEGEC